MSEEIDAQIADAVRVVEPLPPPPLGTLFEDVYADPPWHLREQADELARGPRPATAHGSGH
jgi:TPP-dependent pyruvate/acetoin dehydrogenase alpha subunit